MKQVTITREQLYNALFSVGVNPHTVALIASQIGLDEAHKRKVKLLAWLDYTQGDIYWRHPDMLMSKKTFTVYAVHQKTAR